MQKGYQISFFTEQSRRKDGRPMGNWILETAKNLEIPGATLFPAAAHPRAVLFNHRFAR